MPSRARGPDTCGWSPRTRGSEGTASCTRRTFSTEGIGSSPFPPCTRRWHDQILPSRNWWQWSDRTNGTVHQATLCVEVSPQHDSCPDCNVQHGFQAGCQVAVLLVEPVKFGHSFLGPLLCTGGLVDLIRTEKLDSTRFQPGKHLSVELFARLARRKQTHG